VSTNIFRKVSLEGLSSPEQLDLLMRVTTPKGWVALLAIIILLVCAILWSLFGSIPTKVSGQGILIKTGGVFEVVTTSQGVVKGVYFQPGDIIKKGQVIARLDQQEILIKINDIEEVLLELRNERERVEKFGAKEMGLEYEAINQQRIDTKSSIDILSGQIEYHEENVKSQKKLLADGLITKKQLLKAESDLSNIRLEIKKLTGKIRELDIQVLQIKEKKNQKLLTLDRQINDSQRKLNSLLNHLKKSENVISPHTGKVLEVSVEAGMIVNKGATVILIELIGNQIKNLSTVLYYKAHVGKKIKQGMKVQIGLSTVKQEEFGFLIGIVTSVSDYPSTPQTMMKTLKNESLVKSLSMGGAPISVFADLIPSPTTPSGYRWSSSKGPDITIATGTLCMATVTVSVQKPITLIIPLFKKYLLGIGMKRG